MESTQTSSSFPGTRAASDIAAAAREALGILLDADDFLSLADRQRIRRNLLQILTRAQELGGETRESRKPAVGLTYFADGSRYTGGQR